MQQEERAPGSAVRPRRRPGPLAEEELAVGRAQHFNAGGALRTLAQMGGWLVQRHEIGGPGDFSRLTDAPTIVKSWWISALATSSRITTSHLAEALQLQRVLSG